MAEDVALYLRAVGEAGTAAVLGPVTGAAWERFAAACDGADFTRIHPFVQDSRPGWKPALKSTGNVTLRS